MAGKISIQKIDITKLNTDTIVNAANEGLWAGGGVCGAIFDAAGHGELTKACSAIDGCKQAIRGRKGWLIHISF